MLRTAALQCILLLLLPLLLGTCTCMASRVAALVKQGFAGTDVKERSVGGGRYLLQRSPSCYVTDPMAFVDDDFARSEEPDYDFAPACYAGQIQLEIQDTYTKANESQQHSYMLSGTVAGSYGVAGICLSILSPTEMGSTWRENAKEALDMTSMRRSRPSNIAEEEICNELPCKINQWEVTTVITSSWFVQSHCCNSPGCNQEYSEINLGESSAKEKTKNIAIIAGAVIGGVAGLAVIIGIASYFVKSRK